MQSLQLRHRLRYAGLHLTASALAAALASLLVFVVWYPSPYANLAGGTDLFLLLVAVDVVMGPALTAVAASAGKPRREFARDLVIVVVLQLAAFGYGIYSVALARPVALVHEVDLFRLLSEADLDRPGLSEAPPALRALSWRGPRLMVAVKPGDAAEQLRTIDLALAGIPLAALPRYWRDYAENAPAVWRSARPVEHLTGKYPHAAELVARIAAGAGSAPLRFLPLVARHTSAVALLVESDARIAGVLELDGQF